MNDTAIEWCDCTLNPVVGCTFGCPFCYARRLNDRFHFVEDFSKPQFFPERLKQLYSKKPKTIFMDSMSDIADWKGPWMHQTIRSIEENPQHKYIFLTKRPEICTCLMAGRPKNVLLGMSVPTQKMAETAFEWCRSGIDFLSLEPLLEPVFPIPVNAKWIIVGAQTGPGSAVHQPRREWIQDIVDQCRSAGVPVFLKSSLADVWDAPLIQEFPW